MTFSYSDVILTGILVVLICILIELCRNSYLSGIIHDELCDILEKLRSK